MTHYLETKMKKLISLFAIATMAGCASNDYAQMSAGSGVNEAALRLHCEEISCSYDKLKDNVQASANDENMIFALNGNESRRIQFTWVSNSNQIMVDVFHIALYESWIHANRAEIYVGKEMITSVSARKNEYVGAWNDISKQFEKIETISESISLERAERIAKANYEDITIRFYGKNGYKDVTPMSGNNLIDVVNLAKSAN